MTDTFYTTKEAAAMLKLSPQTLNNWRNLGRGPAFRKLGRSVVYAYSDLMEWVGQRRMTNTQQQ